MRFAAKNRSTSDSTFSPSEAASGLRAKTLPTSAAAPRELISVASDRSMGLLISLVVVIALFAIPLAPARWAALVTLAFIALGYSWLNCRRIEVRAEGLAILHDEAEAEVVPWGDLASVKLRRFGPIQSLVLVTDRRTMHVRLLTSNHAAVDAAAAAIDGALAARLG